MHDLLFGACSQNDDDCHGRIHFRQIEQV